MEEVAGSNPVSPILPSWFNGKILSWYDRDLGSIPDDGLIYNCMWKKTFIISWVILVFVLGLILPQGMASSLLYSIPIVLAAPLKRWKIWVPVVSITLVIAATVLNTKSLLAWDVVIVNKSLVSTVLALIAFISSKTLAKCDLKITELMDMNKELKMRIDRYNSK